jgi:AraC-like DNA-binding protein
LRLYSPHSAMQHEFLAIEDRTSDSPFVERIWTARSLRAGEFLSVVTGHWEMVVTRLHGRAFLIIRGPETRARYENADTFVARLVHKGLIARDPVVETVLDGGHHGVSVRSVQRRFVRATGITYAAYRTIERARYATNLLREGVPIIDVVLRAGYYDQPHLTRSFTYLIGQTPSEVARATRQLSFLYKTTSGREFYGESEGGRLDALHHPDQIRGRHEPRAAAPSAVLSDR